MLKEEIWEKKRQEEVGAQQGAKGKSGFGVPKGLLVITAASNYAKFKASRSACVDSLALTSLELGVTMPTRCNPPEADVHTYTI